MKIKVLLSLGVFLIINNITVQARASEWIGCLHSEFYEGFCKFDEQIIFTDCSKSKEILVKKNEVKKSNLSCLESPPSNKANNPDIK